MNIDVGLVHGIASQTVNIIDTVTVRGAFRGDELAGVAQVRAAALELVKTIEEAAQAAENNDESTEGEKTPEV